MSVFLHFFGFCPLGVTIKMNLYISTKKKSKWSVGFYWIIAAGACPRFLWHEAARSISTPLDGVLVHGREYIESGLLNQLTVIVCCWDHLFRVYIPKQLFFSTGAEYFTQFQRIIVKNSCVLYFFVMYRYDCFLIN